MDAAPTCHVLRPTGRCEWTTSVIEPGPVWESRADGYHRYNMRHEATPWDYAYDDPDGDPVLFCDQPTHATVTVTAPMYGGFCELNPRDPEQVAVFATGHGFLGVRTRPPGHATHYAEKLADWVRENRAMRRMLALAAVIAGAKDFDHYLGMVDRDPDPPEPNRDLGASVRSLIALLRRGGNSEKELTQARSVYSDLLAAHASFKLSRLAVKVQVHLDESAKWNLRVHSSTLLGGLWAMATHVAVNGLIMRRCAFCNEWFTASKTDPRRIYHSDSCKVKAHRAKKEAAANGTTPEQNPGPRERAA